MSPQQLQAMSETTSSMQHEQLRLTGLRCAACAQLIDYRVRKLAGVSAFQILTVSHKALVSWDPEKISLSKIIAAISELGYGAMPAKDRADAVQERLGKQALWRLFVAGFAMMQVMMYAFPGYLVPVPDANGDLTPDLDFLLKIASLLITLPVMLFSAAPFFSAAWRDIKNHHVGMDVPVSLGIALSFLASVWAVFFGGTVYFDSVIMFVFLLLAARYIEAMAQRKTSNALHLLTQMSPPVVLRMEHYPARHQSSQVDLAEVVAGDYLLVPAGEQIPVDGIVIEGVSECDESLMTGESHAVPKSLGSQVMAGTVNLSGVLIVQASHVGTETQLSFLVQMMERAATEKPPMVLMAERYASRFLFLILCLALVSGVAWYWIDPSRALWVAISVIVVTCPCALSLATPGVMAAAIGQLAKHGVLVAKGRAIEVWANATHIVFDKTGTLTYGKLKLVHRHLVDARHEQQGADDICAALASSSAHPVARALVEALQQSVSTNLIGVNIDSREQAGGGIEALLGGKKYRLGRLPFVQEISDIHCQQLVIPDDFSGKTISALGDEGGVIALYALDDVLRSDAPELLETLRQTGKHILLLSGDRAEVVQKIALECGIADAHGDLSPKDKFDMIKALQTQGAIVLMVGDGMNDGPVLSLANVSIAMGQGAPMSQLRSDIVLISNRLNDLAYAGKIVVLARKLIHQNLAWALAYNLLAIPAAVMGLLAPWHAALGMSLSSLFVVLNAMRLLRINQTPPIFTD